MTGFTLYAKGKDIFIETSKTRKTKALAKQIIRAMNGTGEFDIPDNASGIDAVLYGLKKATCEVRTLGNGLQMYEIFGDGFGGHGSFIDDGRTIILSI